MASSLCLSISLSISLSFSSFSSSFRSYSSHIVRARSIRGSPCWSTSTMTCHLLMEINSLYQYGPSLTTTIHKSNIDNLDLLLNSHLRNINTCFEESVSKLLPREYSSQATVTIYLVSLGASCPGKCMPSAQLAEPLCISACL